MKSRLFLLRFIIDNMLKINNLHASVDSTEIIKGVNLEIKPGEVHAIMGPNGSGKSTLANVLMGNPVYEVTKGNIEFNGEDVTEEPVDNRAKNCCRIKTESSRCNERFRIVTRLCRPIFK